MSINSGRQFRSYIISWFLMIVGLIVVLGAMAIFDRAQNYLLTQYKNNKLQQVATIAAMIDGRQHVDLSQTGTTSPLFKTLVRTFKEVGRGDPASLRLFSVNYNSQQKSLIYGADPNQTSVDSLSISSDQFEALLNFQGGQLQLTQRPIVGAIPPKDDAEKATGWKLQLLKNQTQTQLLVNGKEVLVIESYEPLSATFNHQTIDKKNLSAQPVKFEFPQPLTISARFVAKDAWLRPPGSEFFADTEIKTQLIQSLRQSSPQLLSLDPQQLVIDTLAVAPIAANGEAQSMGAVVIVIPAQALQLISEEFLKSVLLIFGMMAVLILIAAIFFSRKITGPLEQLNLAIARLIHNDFNFKLSPKGFGSFHFLAEQFNQMLKHIQQGRNEMINLNKSYSRFVPHQLLKQLSPSGVAAISLGDCCEREMTVLFCDIRGFTTLSESMTPQANFNFINRYLSQIAPVINKRGGIIDKYLGDGIMALFPNGADQALKAAIEMLQALAVYNQRLVQKNLPLIEVGLGLHSGKMMLGTVGTSARMDATVVSDTVNAAARVESMTKSFCTKILITEETKRQLTELQDYRMRYIAACSIQGKSKPVTLYEVFNSDPVSLQKEKAANQSTMIRAWKLYKQGDTASAIALYQRLIERSPNDKSLFALIERCQSGRL